MKKIIYIIFFVLLVSCKQVDKYPESISVNRYESLYDIARWRIYAANFRNTQIKIGNTKYNSNPVSCGLKLSGVCKHELFTCFSFFFYQEEIGKVCFPSEYFVNQVAFLNGDDVPYISMDGYDLTIDAILAQKEIEENRDMHLDFENLGLRPYRVDKVEFPKYLQSYEGELNSWLKKEAINRGILKE